MKHVIVKKDSEPKAKRAKRVIYITQMKSRTSIPLKAKSLMMRFLMTLGSWGLMVRTRNLP